MNLSADQQQALEAKIAMIRRDRDRAASHETVAIKREMAARGMFASGATLTRCWEAIRAEGLKAASAAIKICVQVGARDPKAIHDYVKADYVVYLNSFSEAEAQGSSAATLLESQLRSQAESDAGAFYEEARSLVFDRDRADPVAASPEVAELSIAPSHTDDLAKIARPMTKTIFCNQCRRETRHVVHQSPHRSHYEDDLDTFVVQIDYEYSVCVCAGCEDVTFLREREDNVSPETTNEFFPAREFRQRPDWLRVLRMGHLLTSDPKVELIDEIYTALDHDADRLAIIGLRSLVEHVMIEKVGDHGSFGTNLATFHEAGHITASQRDGLKAVVELGHAVTHRGYSPKRAEFLSALDVTETLIKVLYVDRGALDKLVAGLPPRPPKPLKDRA